MAHITKFKSSAMGQIFAHINRERDQISKYGNADIDPSKTPQNSTLFAGGIEVLQKRVNAVSHTNRRDLVVCCGVVVTLPEELKQKSRFLQDDFFKACHAFLSEKFGPENTVYSVVHHDETTPHLHFGFVPVVEQERKYRSKAKAGQTYTQERISARDCVNREVLSSLHDELQAHISRYFPDVRIVSEKAHRMKKSKSIAELKEASIRHMEQKEAQIDQVAWEAKVWKGAVECWRDEAKLIKEQAEQEVEAIRQKARERGREEASRIRQEAYQDASREAEQIKKNAKPELYEAFKADIQALEAENLRLQTENQRLNLLLQKAKKGLSTLWAFSKRFFGRATPQEHTEILNTLQDCDELIAKPDQKQEQVQKPRVWDEVKKQSRGVSR